MQRALQDGQHQPAVLVVERAHGVVDQHPARLMQEQARKCQALLLLQRQLLVPALLLIERGHEMAEADPHYLLSRWA